jgi:threonine aldolase
MNFASDNVTGISPEILAAIEAANVGEVPSYGEDPITERLTEKLAGLFEHPVTVFPVSTGTAANALALSAIVPPWGAVLCHHDAHIAVDETNAPEFYTGGAKMATMPGSDGKLQPDVLAAKLPGDLGVVHHAQPAAISLTQATESGTVYRADEIAALAEIAHHHGLKVHMDGARFANAVAFLGASPADVTWRAGVDVLSFGATKNGALAAEAIIFFDQALADAFKYRRKRAGHLFSKMRFLSAQLDAFVTDGLWLRNAGHANRAAQRLAAGIAGLADAELLYPVESNEIFLRLPESAIVDLLAQGFMFYRWPGSAIRLVTSFNTKDHAVDTLIAAIRDVLGK